MRVCSVAGCPTIYPANEGGRCQTHRQQARAARVDNKVYSSKGHREFRAAVLERDPICVNCHIAASTIADHHPLSRRELVARGMDPDDPSYGRGLCLQCHSRITASIPEQRGGWNNRE